MEHIFNASQFRAESRCFDRIFSFFRLVAPAFDDSISLTSLRVLWQMSHSVDLQVWMDGCMYICLYACIIMYGWIYVYTMSVWMYV
jgi:hypothetical protein